MAAPRGARKATPAKAAKPAVETAQVEEEVTPESAPEVSEGPAPAAPEVQEETPEQRQIRELQEQVKALLEAQRAVKHTSEALDPEAYFEKPEELEDGEKVLIHFVEDGMTAQGQVWYRGQELEFEVGSPQWQDTLDTQGNSWVLESESEQVDKRGTIYFRRGPWPGKSYKDATWEKDAPPESELERADRLERERRRTAPRLPEVPTA